MTYSASTATSGMTSGSGSINFKFDNIKPVINESITGINGTGGWWKNASLSATSTDAHSGIQTTILTVNGAVRSIPSTVAEGANTIVMTVSDVAGNTTSKTWNVNVDSIAPPQTLASAAADRFFWRDDPIQVSVVGAGGDDAHFLFRVCKTNGDGAVGAVKVDDAVVVAAALA